MPSECRVVRGVERSHETVLFVAYVGDSIKATATWSGMEGTVPPSCSSAGMRRAVGVLVTAMSVVCMNGCLGSDYVLASARNAVENEWLATAPRCSLETAGNTLGAGTIVYCAPSGTASTPTWLYSLGVPYTITDTARALTPEMAAMLDANSETFRQAGLDRTRFNEQIAGMIAAQHKQSASR